MRLLSSQRRRYRPQLFWWADADTIGAGICLAAFFYLCIVGLPIALPDGLAGSMRDQLGRIGFTIEGHR